MVDPIAATEAYLASIPPEIRARSDACFATVALKLGEYRKLSPSPLEEALLFDHTSGRSRILMAMTGKA